MNQGLRSLHQRSVQKLVQSTNGFKTCENQWVLAKVLRNSIRNFLILSLFIESLKIDFWCNNMLDQFKQLCIYWILKLLKYLHLPILYQKVTSSKWLMALKFKRIPGNNRNLILGLKRRLVMLLLLMKL